MNDDYPLYTYDDDLMDAARADGRTRVRVYRITRPVVVLGSGSRPEVELNLEACQRDGIPIMRRRGGGCAVVLDPGNVIVSVVATGLPFGRHRRSFDLLTQWLIDGLARIGIPGVGQAGICDLALGEKKIGGACLHRSGDLLYYSTTLLVDPDIDLAMRYLRHPPREPDYRQGRDHADFMGSLAPLLLELVYEDAAGCVPVTPVTARPNARPRSLPRPMDLGTPTTGRDGVCTGSDVETVACGRALLGLEAQTAAHGTVTTGAKAVTGERCRAPTGFDVESVARKLRRTLEPPALQLSDQPAVEPTLQVPMSRHSPRSHHPVLLSA
jgi:lipoate-protein ligase A